MPNTSDKYELEWWVVQKRNIYVLVVIAAAGILIGAGFLFVRTYGNPWKSAPVEVNDPPGARFVSFEGDVHVVRAQTRESVLVSGSTKLYPGDTVQTAADGRARLLFVDGSTCFVRPDSVVTIRDNTSEEGGERTNVRVALDQGEVNVRTENQTENTSNVVETRLTENHLTAQTGASFDVHKDHTEEIRVSSGAMDTSTRDGDKSRIHAGEYLAISASGAIAKRERAIDVPVPLFPRDLEKIPAGAVGSANVTMRWSRPSGPPSHYSVEIGTSPFFVATGKLAERDQLEVNRFDAGDLREGVYFWRVRAVAASGQASEWSDPRKFAIIAQGNGEFVTLQNVSSEYLAGNIYLVRGRTQPGNAVRAAGRETLASADGSFQLQITSESDREVAIEAEDPQGNKRQYRLKLSEVGR